jgi:hypothetical protein
MLIFGTVDGQRKGGRRGKGGGGEASVCELVYSIAVEEAIL